MELNIGIVKWFDVDKSFGKIETPQKDLYFFHINNCLNLIDSPSKGTALVFNIKENNQGQVSAINCKPVSTYEDWKLILNYLGKPDNITLEIKKKGLSKLGNPYISKEERIYSLKALAGYQLLKKKQPDEIANLVINYFDKDLISENYVHYCEYIEDRIIKHFPPAERTTTAKQILDKVLDHFIINLNEDLIFQAWIKEKYKYISTTKEDTIIKQETILKNIDRIDIKIFYRINNFDYGPSICTLYLDKKINNPENLSTVKVKELFNYLPLIEQDRVEEYTNILNKIYSQGCISEIKEKASKLGLIEKKDDYSLYQNLKSPSYTNQYDINLKKTIESFVNEIIKANTTENFLFAIWLDDIQDKIPFSLIIENFLNDSIGLSNRVQTLLKLPIEEQIKLLKLFRVKYDLGMCLAVLQEYLIRANKQSFSKADLYEKIFDADFWQDKIGNELLNCFNKLVADTATDDENFKLFFVNSTKTTPKHIFINKSHELDKLMCIKLFDFFSTDQEFILNIILNKIKSEESSNFTWLCELAKKYLDKNTLIDFNNKIYQHINIDDYLHLWENKYITSIPEDYIYKLLSNNTEAFIKINNWLNKNLISPNELAEIVIKFLKEGNTPSNINHFTLYSNAIKYLANLDQAYVYLIEYIKNDIYNLILWTNNNTSDLNFTTLSSKFIYFTPKDQVKIIRKLFGLHAKGEFNLSLDILNKLTRADLDTYKLNLIHNPDITLDISTEVIIKSLINFKKHSKFLLESDLLSIVLENTKDNKKKKFKIDSYFESCKGRMVAEYDWNRNGEIRKVPFGNNLFYFAIIFEYTASLVEKVKNIPGSKWNNEEKHWGVPAKFEEQVLQFAKDNKFFLSFQGSVYTNNKHLAFFTRKEVPNGIRFCEGRLANKIHEIFDQSFWWCSGQSCFEKCETIHSPSEWEKYTLLDFCEILNFNLDETNHMGDIVPKGHYYQFISLINRFNRLLEKLYCHECDEILFPVQTSHFAAYNVVRFCCENDTCSKHKQEVYLNHCLNGQCNSIIDSRTSKKCPNGLFICHACGSCCSHGMLDRRLKNLNSTGGKIHSNLVFAVEAKLGHLERAEYFCYKCENHMEEPSPDIFKCLSCNTEYNTTKFRFKRPHRYFNKYRG